MKTFIKQRMNSFKYAFTGLFQMRSETNFRIHLLISIMTIIFGFYKAISSLEWIIIIACIGMVIAFETINTAIEKTINYISLEKHPEAKIIKDISAGAVLITAITSAIIGVIILFIRH